jgi:hypothetical protein
MNACLSATLDSLILLSLLPSSTEDPRFICESARDIPIAYKVDVVVVGGSSSAVSAAVSAANAGVSVFLAAPYPYLGEDMCATLRLWLEAGEIPATPLARRIFNTENGLVTPFHVKKALDGALLDARVQFLFSCYATDILRDADGHPCGIVMANRAGRQAIIAKVIIDATDRAWVARMAGTKFRPFPAGVHKSKRIVIGGDVKTGSNMVARRTGLSFHCGNSKGEDCVYEILEYTLELSMKDGSFVSLAEAEQRARDMIYHEDQVYASDVLFQIPPDPMIGVKSGDPAWEGVEKLNIDAFRPANVPRFFVLGGCADIPREHAEKLLRPLSFMDMGSRIGVAAAEEAKSLLNPRDAKLPEIQEIASVPGDVRECLNGTRPTQTLPTISQGTRILPILGTYDVVIVGGGTSGAAAGIGAARQGCNVLVAEYLHGLGGVGTLGLIGRYHCGYRGGFTSEVDRAVLGEVSEKESRVWNVERKMEWWRTELLRHNADIWFGSIGCGAFVKDGKLAGVVLATPQGRGVVLADVVIDSTGNADIAAAAGAPCINTDDSCVAVQGTGLPVRELGANYTNTDFTITDETDMLDIWQLLVYAKIKYEEGFDLGQIIDTRERRRIVGDFVLSILDHMNHRTYPDTIAQAESNLDSHGYLVDPYLALKHPGRTHCFVPYRCLLPRGLDGILVTGIAMSAHRDAIPFVRMQSDLQNSGYAAGVAAAMAAKEGIGTRQVDIRELQRHLVEMGNLPETVLTDEDSYPMSLEQIAAAVESVRDSYEGVSALLAHAEQALPMLQDAYRDSTNRQDQVTYAHILGIMGDATGLETLIAEVEASPDLGDGYEYRGMGHDHSRGRMSQVDSLILAMGYARDRRAIPAILSKLKLLNVDKPFSHHYAIAVALETIRDPIAARPLADLLSKPGMSGHAIQTLEEAIHREETPLGNASRRSSFREIVLARALFRCSDRDGLARKILQEYIRDLRGHFVRHANEVLASSPE